MTTERVIEIPWALSQLPQSGLVLDVGSCEATYLLDIAHSGRRLHCLDPRGCADEIPAGAEFFQTSLIGCDLPSESYDAVAAISVIEHIGLPFYRQAPFVGGDRLALQEIWRLLRPGAPLVMTVPAGVSQLTTWYRQYSPADLDELLNGWLYTIRYWGFDGTRYVETGPSDVEAFTYRDRMDGEAGAGAVAGIIALRPRQTYAPDQSP